MRDAFKNHQEGYFMFKALGDNGSDRAYPAYFDHFLNQVAAKESNAVAKSLPSILKAIVTDQKSYMDIERISEAGDYNAGKFITNAPEKDIRNYNRIIEKQMHSAGAFTRIYMNSLKR